MNLSDLTPKKRKIVKLIIQKGYDIGVLIDEGLTWEEAVEVVTKGRAKLRQKEIGATQDDINS